MITFDFTNFLIMLVLLIPFVYEFSNRFKLYLKFAVYCVAVMTASVLCIPFIIWRPGDVRNTLLATFPLRILNPLLGLNWQMRYDEHLRVDRAAVIVANHQSSIDFLGMVYMWPIVQKISAIAKKEILYIAPFGPTAWLCGTRFINRSNPQKAKQSMDDALNYIKDNKVKLWIFPEGTRNMTDDFLPFKKGAFHSAIAGQIPILPIVFSSYKGFMAHKHGIFNPGNIIVTCLPPIPTEGLTMDDLPQLLEEIRSKMFAVFKETSQQVVQPYPMDILPAVKSKES